MWVSNWTDIRQCKRFKTPNIIEIIETCTLTNWQELYQKKKKKKMEDHLKASINSDIYFFFQIFCTKLKPISLRRETKSIITVLNLWFFLPSI